MTDRTTKLLLLLIVIGLWLNALGPWMRSAPVSAQVTGYREVDVANDIHAIRAELTRIGIGTCPNDTICPK